MSTNGLLFRINPRRKELTDPRRFRQLFPYSKESDEIMVCEVKSNRV